LANAFRCAEAAHGKYEARIGQGRDANWPDWYAALHGRGTGRHGAAVVTGYDASVIGTGQAGPYVASRLTSAGMKVAVSSATPSAERRQYQLHSDQTRVTGAYAARMAAPILCHQAGKISQPVDQSRSGQTFERPGAVPEGFLHDDDIKTPLSASFSDSSNGSRRNAARS
jgi:hypothetical protein